MVGNSGQYALGLKQGASPLRRSPKKPVAEAAEKAFQKLKEVAGEWKAEAAAESDPVKAYDLYTRITTLFANDPLAKDAASPRQKLTSAKPVQAECWVAPKALDTILAGMNQLSPEQKKFNHHPSCSARQEARELHTFRRAGGRTAGGVGEIISLLTPHARIP